MKHVCKKIIFASIMCATLVLVNRVNVWAYPNTTANSNGCTATISPAGSSKQTWVESQTKADHSQIFTPGGLDAGVDMGGVSQPTGTPKVQVVWTKLEGATKQDCDELMAKEVANGNTNVYCVIAMEDNIEEIATIQGTPNAAAPNGETGLQGIPKDKTLNPIGGDKQGSVSDIIDDIYKDFNSCKDFTIKFEYHVEPTQEQKANKDILANRRELNILTKPMKNYFFCIYLNLAF